MPKTYTVKFFHSASPAGHQEVIEGYGRTYTEARDEVKAQRKDWEQIHNLKIKRVSDRRIEAIAPTYTMAIYFEEENFDQFS